MVKMPILGIFEKKPISSKFGCGDNWEKMISRKFGRSLKKSILREFGETFGKKSISRKFGGGGTIEKK